MTCKILVVDDDPLHAKVLETILKNHLDYIPTFVSGGQAAIDYLFSAKNKTDLVLLDIVMPEIDGIQVLKKIRTKFTKLPVIMLTGHNDISMAVESMKAGANDFLSKKSMPERIRVSIENALKISGLSGELERIARKNEGQTVFSDILGESEEIKAAIRAAEKVVLSNIPVFIEGESGVGKELFARAIHGSGERASGPFVAVNCGAIPENLVESILFGHEKGAFTGATHKTIGKFREANGGTLFLDEVAELKPDMQVKLLRAVQESEVQPVGSAASEKVNVRLVSATNLNLEDMVAKGTFREDLYYRLKVFPLVVPPLRVRKGDVEILLDEFTKKISLMEKRNVNGVSDEAKKMLSEYEWPGNVRELYNSVYRAVVVADSEKLEAQHFPSIVKGRLESNVVDTNFGGAQKPANLRLIASDGEFRKISDMEAEVITSALDYYGWHISEVARRLGIGRSTLYRKMVDIGIKVPPSKEKDFGLAV